MPYSFTNFLEDCQIDLENIQVAADNNTYYGTGVDMLNHEGVVFIAAMRRGIAATMTLKVQQDSDSAFGTAADLAGTAVTDARSLSADAMCFAEVAHPLERYVRPAAVIPNIATATALAIISIRYGLDRRPETNSDGEFHNAPAEGTA